MGLKFANNAKTTIASPPSPALTGLSFTVADGSKFPTLSGGDYFYGTREDSLGNKEIVKITGRSGATMTVDAAGRGVDGTTALTWAAGDSFELRMTNIALSEILSVITDPEITALLGLTSAANKVAYYTGSGAAALADFTARGRAIVAAADHAAARAAIRADFEPGVKATFNQTTAPLRWTKDTTNNDAALRVVSGSVGSGGADAFSALFGTSKTTAGTSITQAQLPNVNFSVTDTHYHGIDNITPNTVAAGAVTGVYSPAAGTLNTTTVGGGGGGSIVVSSGGSGTAHSHTLNNMNLKYVDVIIATKDADA